MFKCPSYSASLHNSKVEGRTLERILSISNSGTDFPNKTAAAAAAMRSLLHTVFPPWIPTSVPVAMATTPVFIGDITVC
jgi:hypothetical protein